MMSIQTHAEGGGGGPELFLKNGAIWRIPSVPKYVIINLKINNFQANFDNSKNYLPYQSSTPAQIIM